MKTWYLIKDGVKVASWQQDEKPTMAATKGEVLEVTHVWTGAVDNPSDYVPEVHKVTTTEGKYYGKWRILHTVAVMTEAELLTESWKHPEWAKRIEAPAALVFEDAGVKMLGWWQIMGYPFEREGDKVHLYCNQILPQHQAIVDQFAGVLTIQDKPI
jgi:hypothetical protein